MNKILLFAFILFQSVVTFGQNESNLSVLESPIYKDKIRTDSTQAIYTTNAGRTVIIRSKKKLIVFDFFNKDLRLTGSKTIELENKEAYIGEIYFNNQVRVFTEIFPKKDKKVLTCYVLNLRNNNLQKIELSSTSIDKRLSLFSNEKSSKVAVSPNLEHFAILSYTIHRDEIFYHSSVFKANNHKLIQDLQTKRNDNKFYDLKEIRVDDNQNVFALAETFYVAESPKLKSEENRNFIIEKFTGEEYLNLDLSLDNKFIKSVKSSIQGNSYNIYGFYSESGLNAIKGVCNFQIDMKGFAIIDKNQQDLPFSVYEDIYGTERGKRKKEKELHNFILNHIILDEIGNVYLLSEEYYITKNNGQSVEHYDDILIFKFNPDGKLDWGRSIFKYDFRPNYNAFVKDDKLHVLLNSGKDLKQLDDGRTKTSKGLLESSALYDFAYDSSGELTISKIQNNKGKSYYLPLYGFLTKGKFIMLADSKNERRLMSLE